jgi:hypothetical protein
MKKNIIPQYKRWRLERYFATDIYTKMQWGIREEVFGYGKTLPEAVKNFVDNTFCLKPNETITWTFRRAYNRIEIFFKRSDLPDYVNTIRYELDLSYESQH